MIVYLSSIDSPIEPGVGNDEAAAADRALISAIWELGNGDNILVLDARPRLAALGHTLTEGGTEIGYPHTKLRFAGIGNIHAMRAAHVSLLTMLVRVRSNPHADRGFYVELDATKWLHHLHSVLEGAHTVASALQKGTSVLIHCSDGWDRTPQLAALAQLLVDPQCRTLLGFAHLIEKEFILFGHPFSLRHAPLGREASPIFLQFLEATWQLLRQFPDSFEFNESLLILLADAAYERRYGTFLASTPEQRVLLETRAWSVWSHVFREKEQYSNKSFIPNSDPLPFVPAFRRMRLWEGYWFRWDVT